MMDFGFNKKPEHYWRNIATRTVLVLLTTVLIVWFLPRNEGSKFVYEVGQPWRYPEVIAKYDFPVIKTDEQRKHEEDSLMQQFMPYFNYDGDVEKQALAKFRKDFASGVPGVPESYYRIILDRLHRLYQAGIMETPDYNAIHRDTTSLVHVIYKKNVDNLSITCIYSTMSAYETLLSDDELAPGRGVLQRLNLNNYIDANLIYDKQKSETEKNDLLSSISRASGMVLAGQKIISTGEIVSEKQYRELGSMEYEMQRRSDGTETIQAYNLLGNTLYVLLLVSLFTIYLALFRKDYFGKPRSLLMLYTFIVIFPILTSLMMNHNFFSVYVLPFAFTAIFVRVFLDSRTAFITHLTMVLICADAVHNQFEFIVVETVAGLVAIYSLREMSARSQVFRTALLVFLATCLTHTTLRLVQSGTQVDLDTGMYYHFLFNGVLLLLAYPLMYIVEKTFGFTSNITLLELSNTNRGLLRTLSEVAPGTFQHSITVGNLASEIANRIGANATLVRTGALYHDIGKITNPAFFTENQQGGINPHDNLTDKESAQVIISHVTNGVKLAEEANLPVVIRDFILTHHGHGLAKYFYVKYQNEHPDEVVDKEPFTYPGPNPYTREQAILMMADSCEAASHSLKDYSEESITALVNKIIDGQVAAGFFTEAPITFRDISEAKAVLIERLKAIYHTRIKYPELKK